MRVSSRNPGPVAITSSGCCGSFSRLKNSPVRGARVDVAAVGQERQRAAAADRVEQPDAELSAQRLEQHAQMRATVMPLPPQIREHQQFEQIDRRVAALGVAAAARCGFGATCDANSRCASHHCSWRAVSPVSAATSRAL